MLGFLLSYLAGSKSVSISPRYDGNYHPVRFASSVSERKTSTISVVVELPDHHCGDDFVGKNNAEDFDTSVAIRG